MNFFINRSVDVQQLVSLSKDEIKEDNRLIINNQKRLIGEFVEKCPFKKASIEKQQFIKEIKNVYSSLETLEENFNKKGILLSESSLSKSLEKAKKAAEKFLIKDRSLEDPVIKDIKDPLLRKKLIDELIERNLIGVKNDLAKKLSPIRNKNNAFVVDQQNIILKFIDKLNLKSPFKEKLIEEGIKLRSDIEKIGLDFNQKALELHDTHFEKIYIKVVEAAEEFLKKEGAHVHKGIIETIKEKLAEAKKEIAEAKEALPKQEPKHFIQEKPTQKLPDKEIVKESIETDENNLLSQNEKEQYVEDLKGIIKLFLVSLKDKFISEEKKKLDELGTHVLNKLDRIKNDKSGALEKNYNVILRDFLQQVKSIFLNENIFFRLKENFLGESDVDQYIYEEITAAKEKYHESKRDVQNLPESEEITWSNDESIEADEDDFLLIQNETEQDINDQKEVIKLYIDSLNEITLKPDLKKQLAELLIKSHGELDRIKDNKGDLEKNLKNNLKDFLEKIRNIFLKAKIFSEGDIDHLINYGIAAVKEKHNESKIVVRNQSEIDILFPENDLSHHENLILDQALNKIIERAKKNYDFTVSIQDEKHALMKIFFEEGKTEEDKKTEKYNNEQLELGVDALENSRPVIKARYARQTGENYDKVAIKVRNARELRHLMTKRLNLFRKQRGYSEAAGNMTHEEINTYKKYADFFNEIDKDLSESQKVDAKLVNGVLSEIEEKLPQLFLDKDKSDSLKKKLEGLYKKHYPGQLTLERREKTKKQKS